MKSSSPTVTTCFWSSPAKKYTGSLFGGKWIFSVFSAIQVSKHITRRENDETITLSHRNQGLEIVPAGNWQRQRWECKCNLQLLNTGYLKKIIIIILQMNYNVVGLRIRRKRKRRIKNWTCDLEHISLLFQKFFSVLNYLEVKKLLQHSPTQHEPIYIHYGADQTVPDCSLHRMKTKITQAHRSNCREACSRGGKNAPCVFSQFQTVLEGFWINMSNLFHCCWRMCDFPLYRKSKVATCDIYQVAIRDRTREEVSEPTWTCDNQPGKCFRSGFSPWLGVRKQ